jgi:hypothetical protein
VRDPLLVTLAALAAFGLSLSAPFHLDDHAIIAGAVPPSTRPLTWLLNWMQHRIAGDDPWSWHAVNIALHAATSLLAWRALARLLPARAALIAALVFAVHPVQSETVCYVYARSALLMTSLCMLALASWLAGRPWRAATLFALATLAKEECAAFPIALGMLSLASPRALAAMLGIALAAGLRVAWIASSTPGSGAGAEAGIAPLDYLAAQGPVIAHYARMIVLPWGFSVEPSVATGGALRIVACWALVVAAAMWALRRWSADRPPFWIALALVALAPSSSIFPAAEVVAYRRLYLPMIFVAAGAGLALTRMRPPVIAALAVVLGALSLDRSNVWRSERALWTEAVAASPLNVRPRIHLARAVPPAEALPVLEAARRLAPDDPRVAAEMGRVHLESGNAAAALTEFGRAAALEPRNARAWLNRGVALLALGDAETAKGDFARALLIEPCLDEARRRLERLGAAAPPPRGCPTAK